MLCELKVDKLEKVVLIWIKYGYHKVDMLASVTLIKIPLLPLEVLH
jgi:hypothetical protein